MDELQSYLINGINVHLGRVPSFQKLFFFLIDKLSLHKTTLPAGNEKNRINILAKNH